MVGAGTVFGVAAFPLSRLRAQANPVPWQEVLTKIVGEAKPLESKVTIEIPGIVENGNIVPISISVVSPMTESDYVKSHSHHLDRQPASLRAGLPFHTAVGQSKRSRIRLTGTQELISLADSATGSF